MKSFFFPLIAALAMLAGCGNCKEITCADYDNGLMLLDGFSAADADTVIIRRLTAQSGIYDTLLTHAYIDNNRKLWYLSDERSYDGYQVEIYFPALSKTVRLADAGYDNATVQDCPGLYKKEMIGCTRFLQHCTIDGVPVSRNDMGWAFTIRR